MIILTPKEEDLLASLENASKELYGVTHLSASSHKIPWECKLVNDYKKQYRTQRFVTGIGSAIHYALETVVKDFQDERNEIEYETVSREDLAKLITLYIKSYLYTQYSQAMELEILSKQVLVSPKELELFLRPKRSLDRLFKYIEPSFYH